MEKNLNSNIDWHSNTSHLLLNPRLAAEATRLWEQVLLLDYPGHIWLTTSGSTEMKLVALHKKAFMSSAVAVNQHLHANQKDIWINPLPLFHVGGLSIYTRAFVSQSQFCKFENKWDAKIFRDFIEQKKGSLTSLVPAQVYDLVVQGLKAPQSLRAVIVGGGALEASLYKEAKKLHWPLLPSFGMTECCSQIATASLQSLQEIDYPALQILSHVDVKTDEEGRVSIKSPALLSAYALLDNDKIVIQAPVEEGYFLTRDYADVANGFMQIRGRKDDFIKIGGESVEMARLEKILEELKLGLCVDYDAAVVAVPDVRLGHVVHFVVTGDGYCALQDAFNQKVMPYEKIRQVHVLDKIPRSPLGKLLRNDCARMINS